MERGLRVQVLPVTKTRKSKTSFTAFVHCISQAFVRSELYHGFKRAEFFLSW